MQCYTADFRITLYILFTYLFASDTNAVALVNKFAIC